MVRVVQDKNLIIVYSDRFLFLEWILEESDFKNINTLRCPDFHIGGEGSSFLEIRVHSLTISCNFCNLEPLLNGSCVFIIYDKHNSCIRSIIKESKGFLRGRVRINLFGGFVNLPSNTEYPITVNCTARSSTTDLLQVSYVDREIGMNNLSSDLMKILQQSYNTDIELSTGGENIKAHKIILQARSPVFQKMFEHDSSESAKNTVDVSDINPSTMKRLVKYLYTGRKEKCNFDEVVQLYYASDKYEVMSLLEDCRAELLNYLDVNNACFLLLLANRHNDSVFEEKVVKFVSANFMSIINMDSFLELNNENIGLLMRLCVSAVKK
ncbi:protein maternal effect lethal 26-like [Parasteatoda tepidariorum]|uniref:protein maternal effect lethal 26-like n=1 Tax=Parasteatoda tepidariorum TaxID=114398 RepID=UPI001C71C936|nr:BTB and MATH domain-containing protein 43-like [Parasteatoda tepidariorum]